MKEQAERVPAAIKIINEVTANQKHAWPSDCYTL
jgi:hypothetical protein